MVLNGSIATQTSVADILIIPVRAPHGLGVLSEPSVQPIPLIDRILLDCVKSITEEVHEHPTLNLNTSLDYVSKRYERIFQERSIPLYAAVRAWNSVFRFICISDIACRETHDVVPERYVSRYSLVNYDAHSTNNPESFRVIRENIFYGYVQRAKHAGTSWQMEVVNDIKSFESNMKLYLGLNLISTPQAPHPLS